MSQTQGADNLWRSVPEMRLTVAKGLKTLSTGSLEQKGKGHNLSMQENRMCKYEYIYIYIYLYGLQFTCFLVQAGWNAYIVESVFMFWICQKIWSYCWWNQTWVLPTDAISSAKSYDQRIIEVFPQRYGGGVIAIRNLRTTSTWLGMMVVGCGLSTWQAEKINMRKNTRNCCASGVLFNGMSFQKTPKHPPFLIGSMGLLYLPTSTNKKSTECS